MRRCDSPVEAGPFWGTPQLGGIAEGPVETQSDPKAPRQLITLMLTRPNRAMEKDYRHAGPFGAPDQRPMEGDKALLGWRGPGRSRLA